MKIVGLYPYTNEGWSVYDKQKKQFSTLLCFSKYSTKTECEIMIRYAINRGLTK